MNSRGGAGRGGGGGRGRFRGSSRFDGGGGGGGRQGSHPPSRHLWVGNLSHNIEEYDLTRHFLEFGDLDKVSFHPGRSYAFINFRNDEDAIAAYKVLQGFPVDGLPLRIEFAKADKPSSSSRDEDHEQLSPSEVLWISFPAVLKVDEAILRKAFSQFGEIERITVIPGRSYAFVQFRALSSACRAKETLQGKLFGNPRVHISYARNEGRPRSPRLVGDSSDGGGGRYDFVGGGKSSQFDSWRFEEELGPPPNVYERRGGALRGVGRKSSLLYEEEQWDLPAEDSLYPSNKKLKTGSFEHELPDHHPYSDQESRRAPQGGFADFPYQPEGRGRNVDRWKGSYEDIQQSPAGEPLLHVPVERKRFGGSSEPVVTKPSLKLWQWEGAIAKGGSLVCQARAFPVGKSMEIMLPGYLDCTARTSLDMLSKHYDQAASAWVIFFVPASDADMGHYNEFMHYLGEKQRAAVAKLDERTTLFLVPPSEFSEKVLKVPGDMSISGVVLRLEPQVSNSVVRPPHEPNLHFQGDAHMPYKAAPLPQQDSVGMPPAGFSGSVHPSHGGSMSNAYADHRNEYLPPPQPRNRIDMSPQQASGAGNDLVYHHDPHHQGALPGNSSGHYAGGRSNNMSIQQQPTPHSVPSSLGAAGLQPQQLAQLVSSLLGQQGQLGGNNPDPSIADDPRKGSSLAAQTHDLHNNNQQNYEPSSQYGQLQHLQQQTANVLTAMNRDMQSTAVGQMNPPSGVQGGTAGSQGGVGDVKKLEATLELAATLLKQLQQGKGP